MKVRWIYHHLIREIQLIPGTDSSPYNGSGKLKSSNIIEHIFHYRPQRSCGQGYVFTRVCDSVHRGGLWRTPPDQADTPDQGEPPQDQGEPPWDQADTPPGTRENPPGPMRTPPPRYQADTPPGRRLQHTVNERPVRILLECIVPTYFFGMHMRRFFCFVRVDCLNTSIILINMIRT